MFPELAVSGLPLLEFLAKHGFQVFYARNVFEADEFLCIENFDVIVVGLAIDPSGLTEEQKQKCQNSWITGWVWLMENASAYISKAIISASDEAFSILEANISKAELAQVVKIKHGDCDAPNEIIEAARRLASQD